MTPDTAIFIACCTFAGALAGKEVARWYAGRHERRRLKAEAAREELAALTTAALWEEANARRAKAREDYAAARERGDTRGEGMAALTARQSTTRALQLELGR